MLMKIATLRRLGLRLLIVALAGVALVAGLALFAIFTAPGTRLAVSALDRIAGPVDIGKVDGTLAGAFELNDVVVETARFDARLERIYLNVQLRPLLSSRLSIDSVHIEGGRIVERAPASAETSEASPAPSAGPIELPLDTRIAGARIESLAIELQNGTRITRLAASLQGRPNRFAFDGSARILAPGVAPGHLTLSLTGGLDSVRISRATLEIEGNRVTARGSVALRPRLAWDLALSADSIDSSAILRDGVDWPGMVSARATTRGVREENRWRGAIQLDTVFGTLRGRGMAGHTSVGFELGSESSFAIDTVYLDWGDARVSGRGVAGDRLDFSFRADVPHLSLALPGASGSFRTWGTTGGSPSAPRFDAAFAGYGLSYRQARIDSVSGTIDARPDLAGVLSLDVAVAGAEWGERSIRKASIEVEGSRAQHTIDAQLGHGEGDLRIEAAGTLRGKIWRGQIHRLQLATARAGDWQLADDSTALVASPDSARLPDDLCLVSIDSHLCVTGYWHRDANWRIATALSELPLALTEQLTPASWSLSGRLSGDVIGRKPADGPIQLDATLRSDRGLVSYVGDGQARELVFQDGELQASIGAEGAGASVDLKLGFAGAAAPGTVSAYLELPGYHGFGPPGDDQAISGRLDLHLEDPGILESAVPPLQDLSGRIDLFLLAGGTMGQPRFRGQLDWEAGRARLPELGVELVGIHLSAIGEESGLLTVEGTVRSGDGQLTFSGESPLTPSPDAPATLWFRGDRFRAVNKSEVQLDASPDLEVAWDGNLLDIEGDVEIPHARIELSESTQGVPVSEDVVFVDSIAAEETGPELAATVRLALGDDVQFSGFGLTGKLEGSVKVVEEPQGPTTGTGEVLIVDGSYQIYGQELTVDTGRVILAGGPIDNPGLDVRAFRVAKDSVVAGVIVRGTLNAPVITLFSDPSMSRQRILAYLVAGGSVGTATASDGGGIAGFLTKLGAKAGNTLTETIAADLNLEEARIKTEGSLSTASVIAGKYLSPRLYVSAGIGIFDPDKSLQLRYLLTNQFTLLAETGDETSADILFQIEPGE